jgi:hypothetical protein
MRLSPGSIRQEFLEFQMRSSIPVSFKVGFDADGYKQAICAYLEEKIRTGEAMYTREFCDKMEEETYAMMEGFFKIETFVLTPA